MATSDRQLVDAHSRMPFVESTELVLILGEPHATAHRILTDLTDNGVRETAELLDFDTPSDFVRAYPMSREWLTLLLRRMDAVASVYHLAATCPIDLR